MKKAPKKYAKGGETYGDPKKKKVIIAAGTNTPNLSYPSVNTQMAQSGAINPTTAKILDTVQQRTNSGGISTGAQKTSSIQNAGTPFDSGRTFIANDANGNTTYKDNKTGETYTLDKEGNRYNKGGTVKMKKAPCKMKKGGTC